MKENNRLIAEFMGYALNENDEYPIEYITVQGHWDTCSIQDLNYHKSWDWLMKVVEKIESLGYDVFINTCVCRITDVGQGTFEDIETFNYENKIKAVYDACVVFINFYNKQKKE